ncbi:DUF4260 domain-containing protein [Mucilaginibacter jinjuensis]|uniref:DUF4260 domain-containing protein n=1 Tax=Mucilaginibacter jinjuensis TaxID=1176721 RepID=A0ABY7TAM4_9SPHI|nr:DUF4260 domain-containing protein [Mucilaginibacter jinjuensis]WCT13239.1 DUF4260 domain-containing protein [Mucilaginibacter jinjuensis]
MPFTRRMFLSIQIEEAAMTSIAVYFLTFHGLGISFWWWILLFFSPDISMLGYLVGSKAGGWLYNLFHHRALALTMAFTGFLTHQEIVMAAGILLFAHSSFDRMLGFGLKYPDSFNHTNLGWTGKDERATL